MNNFSAIPWQDQVSFLMKWWWCHWWSPLCSIPTCWVGFKFSLKVNLVWFEQTRKLSKVNINQVPMVNLVVRLSQHLSVFEPCVHVTCATWPKIAESNQSITRKFRDHSNSPRRVLDSPFSVGTKSYIFTTHQNFQKCLLDSSN
jgi:hypothetical protein